MAMTVVNESSFYQKKPRLNLSLPSQGNTRLRGNFIRFQPRSLDSVLFSTVLTIPSDSVQQENLPWSPIVLICRTGCGNAADDEHSTVMRLGQCAGESDTGA
jgi:hypothetical protein